MVISDAQLARRSNKLGGSDLAALLGIDPYKSLHDLWLDKTGRLEPLEANAAMDAGNMFENGVLQFAERELGKITRNQYRVCPGTKIATNIDAIVDESGNPVEGKTAGLFGPLPQGWGEEYTDEVPNQYVVQCQGHMLTTEKPICHLPAFLGGRGFVMYTIERSKPLCDEIMERAEHFWHHNVEKDIPPDDLPTLEAAKRIVRVEGEATEVKCGTVEDYVEAKADAKAAAEREKECRRRLMAEMGTSEVARPIMGEKEATFFEQKRKGFDASRLKEEHPDLFARYSYESKHRVLRLRKRRIDE